MKKILIFILGMFLFTGCTVSQKFYRIKDTSMKYNYEYDSYPGMTYGCNLIYLSDDEKRVVLGLNMDSDIYNKKEDVIYISVGAQVSDEELKKYKVPILENDVEIIEKNGKIITLSKENFKYRSTGNFKGVYIYVGKKLKGSITFKLGKIKINGITYEIPPLYMQKYKQDTTWSMFLDMLNIPTEFKFTHEEWVEE